MAAGTLKMRLEESNGELFKLKPSFSLHWCTKIVSTTVIFIMNETVHIAQSEWTQELKCYNSVTGESQSF